MIRDTPPNMSPNPYGNFDDLDRVSNLTELLIDW